VSIKLFRKWFVQFTIIWFIQALSKAVQPELSLFHVLQSNQHFFLFYRNWVKSVTNQDQIMITIFFLDVMIIYTVIEYIIYYLYKHSEPFSVF